MIFKNDIPKLGYLHEFSFRLGCKSESVTSDNCSGMNCATFTKNTFMINLYSRDKEYNSFLSVYCRQYKHEDKLNSYRQ